MNSRQYFQPYKDYFWQWEDGGEVVAIPGGNTIVYKDLVVEVLTKLSDQGLPFFGTMLLALLATNPEGEQNIGQVEKILFPHLPETGAQPEPLTSALSFLKLLASLPANYRQGSNRLLLLQTLFANCHNHLSIADSEALVGNYHTTYVVGDQRPAVETFPFHLYHKEFTVVKLLEKRFPSVEVIIAKIASLPPVEELLLPDEEQKQDQPEKSFVDALLENNKTFHVGSLLKRLWSGLLIPYHNTLSAMQPLGGVSDLTNKGDLHRLLLSEFANDDVILLSRLANSEALYMNREVPPQNNQLERVFLLDVSIKNWGTPKTLAFALAMAIANHPKTTISCSVFLVGEQCRVVHFSTVEEVIESLQWVEPSLHPLQGLQQYVAQHKNNTAREVFYITTHESFRHPLVQHFFSNNTALCSYWFLTDAEGNIDLYKRQHNSRKHVQHLQLPLQELWKRDASTIQKMEKIKGMDFPILFPGTVKPKKVLTTSDDSLFIITTEKALLRTCYSKDKPRKGWEMIADRLQMSGNEVEIGCTTKGEYLLLLFKEGNTQLTLMNLSTGEKKQTVSPELGNFSQRKFFFYNDKFYCRLYTSGHAYWIISSDDDFQIEKYENPSPEIRNYFLEANSRTEKAKKEVYQKKDVLKNVSTVFINQVGNLVFNCHELRLTDKETIRLEKTSFTKDVFSAQKDGQVFCFRDGSTVNINRSGMLILQSSDISLSPIYIPSVLDTTLGVATSAHFAGDSFYYHAAKLGTIVPPKIFWKEYMKPFVENITSYGTQVKAL